MIISGPVLYMYVCTLAIYSDVCVEVMGRTCSNITFILLISYRSVHMTV